MKAKFILFILPLFLMGPVNLQAQKADSMSIKPTTLIFVRHAEKLDDGTRDPKLSEEGKNRALKLATLLLQEFEIQSIYSTNYQRTLRTAEPLADSLNIEVLLYEWEAPEAFADQLLKKHKGEAVLIVGHSNTTPVLVNMLLRSNTYEMLAEDEYGSMFVVRAEGDSILSESKLQY